MLRQRALFFTIFLCCVARCLSASDIKDLISLLADNGGFAGLEVRAGCEGCGRAAFATRSYKKGELVSRIPHSVLIDLGPEGYEAYTAFADMVHANTTFNETQASFWNSQPSPDAVLTFHCLPSHTIDLLQSSKLQKLIHIHRRHLALQYKQWIASLRSRVDSNYQLPPFKAYQYLVSLVASRAFFKRVPGEASRTTLVPVMDMLNHAEDSNVNKKQVGDDFVYFATKDIAQGEELLYRYHTSMIHRSDLALIMFGFLPEQDPPLLCASDLPGFNVNAPWERTALDDSALGMTDAHQEIRRLEHLLNKAGSTIDEDLSLLEDYNAGRGEPKQQGWTWKEALTIKFRVKRKQAILHRLHLLREKVAEL